MWWERAGSNPQRAFLRKDIFGTAVLTWLTPRAAERDLPRGPMEQQALPSWIDSITYGRVEPSQHVFRFLAERVPT